MTAALAAVPALPLRAAIYCRLSLDKDGTAESVADQEREGREVCEREGLLVADVFVDNDISAYSGKRRPDYERLVSMMQSGQIDVVIARRQDRIVRSSIGWGMFLRDCMQQELEVYLTWEGGWVDLKSAHGRLISKIKADLAEHESEQIGERVRGKHMANAKKGRAHGGGRPFGYDRVGPGELAINEAEAELVHEAAHRILRGSSLNSIVIEWNERGIPTVNGGKWRPNSLSKVLRAGRIAGLREVGGEVLGEGSWEPILDRPTWERVRSRITNAPIGRRPRRHLLAGMCNCMHSPAKCPNPRCDWCKGRAADDVCGARMRSISGGNDKYRDRAYQCDKAIAHGCGSNAVKAQAVENIVLGYVFAALPRVNLAQARARRTIDASAALVASIAADEQMLNDLAADLGARRLTRAEWLAARGPIEARLIESRRQLEQVAADSDLDDTAFDGVTPETFEELELDQQRAIVRLFVDHVEIRKGGPGRSFDPTRVKVVPA